MEVEFQGSIFHQIRAEIPPVIKPNNTHIDILRIPSTFGENFPYSCSRWKSVEVHCNNSQSLQHSAVSTSDSQRLPELSFNRLQPCDKECDGLRRHKFGRFLAREAVLDEEYWTAAWLRAEAHWESVSYMRHIEAFKRKYAEQEFYALKSRCSGQDGNSLKCFCLVAMKREEKNVRRTVLNSVVGTLDLSIRQFLQGEIYPGETKRSSGILASQVPFDAHKYAYVANVCVSKFVRRQGIASNLLHLATDVAVTSGMKQLFVHVNLDNKAAQELYSKAGFEVWHPNLPNIHIYSYYSFLDIDLSFYRKICIFFDKFYGGLFSSVNIFVQQKFDLLMYFFSWLDCGGCLIRFRSSEAFNVEGAMRLL